jgi:hypothetical protein
LLSNALNLQKLKKSKNMCHFANRPLPRVSHIS